MQQALPYPSWVQSTPPPSNQHQIHSPSSTTEEVDDQSSRDINNKDMNMKMVKNMVMENAVIVFGRHGCCMSLVIKRLLLALGVNPAIYEVDNEEEELRLFKELTKLVSGGEDSDVDIIGGGNGNSSIRHHQFPLVYIGGRLFGGLDELMKAHISAQLTPLLKKAGALWL